MNFLGVEANLKTVLSTGTSYMKFEVNDKSIQITNNTKEKKGW